jgi:hypothetical protein
MFYVKQSRSLRGRRRKDMGMKKEEAKPAAHPFFGEEPPEYPGFDKAMPAILRELWEIKRLLVETQMAVTLKTYSAMELSQCFGVSYSLLQHKPWKLPKYGRPDIGTRPGKWLFSTVLEWYAIPEDERKRRWEFMSSHERRVAMGSIPDDQGKKPDGGEKGHG